MQHIQIHSIRFILFFFILTSSSDCFAQAQVRINNWTRKLQWIYPSFSSLDDTDTGVISPDNALKFLRINAAGDSITVDTAITKVFTCTGPDCGGLTADTSDILDMTSGVSRVPNNDDLPGVCTVGDSFMDTNATSGARWLLCETTNNFVVQGGGGVSNLWTEDTGLVIRRLNAGGMVINEEGGNVDLRVEGNTITNLFIVDASDDDVEIAGGLNITLPADDSVVIDGSTNQRTIDAGLFQITQTPAIENTRAINIVLDINSQATSHAQVTNVIATGLAPGETATAYDTNVDRSTSTGGVIRGYEMSIAGAGTAAGHLMHADPGVVPLTHFSGTFINVEQAWDENGGFTDVTTAFNSTVTDVTLFNANNDMVHIGMASAFNQIQVNLATNAGGAGIKPVFEYSSGGGTPVWTVFTPQDETQGFRQTGVINWDINDLVTPTWAAATINSVSKLYIRITRTQASIPTDPIEDTIQVVEAIVYKWDENGQVFVGALTTGINSRTITIEGSSETVKIISHINDSFADTIEFTGMKHSDTAANGTHFLALRSRGTHASSTIVQDNDIIFHLRGAGHDGTDFNDLASIFFEVDGTPGNDDMPGRIVFSTSPDGSNALAKRMTIDSTGLVSIDGLTASELLATDASKGLVSLAVATYPSLAELAYVKGVTSAIQTQIDTKGAHAGQVWTGDQNFGGAVFEVTNSATPTTDATGEIALDTTITDHQPLLQYFDGGENMTIIAIDTAQLPALDNEIIKYDAASDKFVLEADAGGSAATTFSWTMRPQQAKLPGTAPMGIDAGNSRWRGLLDDTVTDESATWETTLFPYQGGTLAAKIFYTLETTSSSVVAAFDLLIDCRSDTDVNFDTDSYGTTNSIDSPSQSLTAGVLDVLTDSSLNEDSCAEFDHISVKVFRDVSADGVTDDIELRKVLIYEL